MYYEYYLENDLVICDEKPYIDGFWMSVGEYAYCVDLEEWYEVDTFVKVRYCLLKEGELINKVDTDDYWIENVELGD